MTKTFLLLFFAVMTASVYGQTYPGTPVSNPVRTYTQNDTKGVWVIGNGAPIFSPTAKMSQLYFDYMNQTGYFWNGSAWVAWTNDFLRTASNGLTEDGTDVKLGGTLTEPTTIDLDGNDFIIQGAGTMGFDIIGDIALISKGGVEIRPDSKFEVHTLGNIEVNAAQDIDINTDDVINIQAVNGGSIIADNNDFVLEATVGDVQLNSPGTTAGVVNGIAYKSDIANSVAVTDYGVNITTAGVPDNGKVWTYNSTSNEMELVSPGDITPYTVTAPITLSGHDIGHAASGVTPGTYGSQTAAAVVTVDATGHVTGATTTTIIPGVNTIGANQLTSGLRDSIVVNNWHTLGNAGTVQANNFIGTTDAIGLSLRTNNTERFKIDALGSISLPISGVTASLPMFTMTGTWFTGGTGTTTKPHLLVEPSGATSTAWSTAGTGIGVNAALGFTGNLIDLKTNNTSNFYVTGAGTGVFAGGVQVNGNINFSTMSGGTTISNNGVFTGSNNTVFTIGGTTANTQSIFNVTKSFTSSGVTTFTGYEFGSIINQAGSGIIRGVYINPTLTLAADFRAIDVTRGRSIFAGRLSTGKGANVASAGTLTLGDDGNVFHITGTTAITAITTTSWQAGSEITLIFDSTASITAGANMLLAGAANFNGTANDVIKLVWDGTSWFEVSRSIN